MKNITKENIDQWMFQNVEGELSSEMANELSAFIITNPSLEADFNAWNNANFRGIEIEQFKKIDSIVKKKKFIWRSRYTFLLGLFIGAMVWIPFAFKGGSKNHNRIMKIDEKSIFPKIEKEQENRKIILKNEVSSIHTKRSFNEKTVENMVPTSPIKINQKEEFNDVETETIELLGKTSISKIKKSRVRRKDPKKVYIKPYKTKKQLRKEKREARRKARKPEIKYINGPGPGVIPMNNLGF